MLWRVHSMTHPQSTQCLYWKVDWMVDRPASRNANEMMSSVQMRISNTNTNTIKCPKCDKEQSNAWRKMVLAVLCRALTETKTSSNQLQTTDWHRSKLCKNAYAPIKCHSHRRSSQKHEHFALIGIRETFIMNIKTRNWNWNWIHITISSSGVVVERGSKSKRNGNPIRCTFFLSWLPLYFCRLICVRTINRARKSIWYRTRNIKRVQVHGFCSLCSPCSLFLFYSTFY